MRFLLLVYLNETEWLAMPASAREQLFGECDTYGDEMQRKGHLLGGAPLQPTSTATTIRRRVDRIHLSDGPFAETKEVLAGYHLVECRDRDEAIALGQRFPGLRHGMAIEVRALMERGT